jgi:hypothetical protein
MESLIKTRKGQEVSNLTVLCRITPRKRRDVGLARRFIMQLNPLDSPPRVVIFLAAAKKKVSRFSPQKAVTSRR